MSVSLSGDPAPVPSGRFIASWALLAGIVMFALGIYRNDFPPSYHPDEPSKVAQLLDGTRNYHHPPLMLTLADAAAHIAGVPRQPAALARVGRTLSAAYLAGAVALLTVLAGIYGGTRGSVVVAAAALGTNAQAVLAGHFFKEDALFAFALVLTFVAGAVHWRRRGTWDRLALGAAAGFAVSSKYIGAVAVIYAIALVVLAATRGGERSMRGTFSAVGVCACGMLAAILVCDGPALWGNFDALRSGWRLGMATVQEGNGGVGAQVPHLQFVGMFLLTPVPILLGAAVFWAQLRRRPFLQDADRWLTGLSPLWLTLVFSFSASTAVRYFLPVSLLLACLGGTAWPEVIRWLATKCGPRAPFLTRPGVPMAAAVAILLVFCLPETIALLTGFGRDDRAELGRWIRIHVPPGAVIAEDSLAQLPPVAMEGQRLLIDAPVVADLGDVPALRARGINYVVVCWYDSRRYVDPHKQPGAEAHDFLRRREFYESLPTHARSLWKSDLRQPFPLRPGLELFALDP